MGVWGWFCSLCLSPQLPDSSTARFPSQFGDTGRVWLPVLPFCGHCWCCQGFLRVGFGVCCPPCAPAGAAPGGFCPLLALQAKGSGWAAPTAALVAFADIQNLPFLMEQIIFVAAQEMRSLFPWTSLMDIKAIFCFLWFMGMPCQCQQIKWIFTRHCGDSLQMYIYFSLLCFSRRFVRPGRHHKLFLGVGKSTERVHATVCMSHKSWSSFPWACHLLRIFCFLFSSPSDGNFIPFQFALMMLSRALKVLSPHL